MRPPSSMASLVPGALYLRDNRFQLEREYRECGFGSAGTRDPQRRDAGSGRGEGRSESRGEPAQDPATDHRAAVDLEFPVVEHVLRVEEHLEVVVEVVPRVGVDGHVGLDVAGEDAGGPRVP